MQMVLCDRLNHQPSGRWFFHAHFSILPMIQAATAGCFFHTPGKAQTGLDRDGFRSQAEGFGRSEASRATWENKKQQVIIDRFTQKMESNGYHVSGFSDYVGDSRTLEEMQSAFEKSSQLYPDESKGLTIAQTYTDDPDTLGWFDHKTGRIHFSREKFKIGKLLKKNIISWLKRAFSPGNGSQRMLLSRIRSFFQLSTRVEKLSKNGR